MFRSTLKEHPDIVKLPHIGTHTPVNAGNRHESRGGDSGEGSQDGQWHSFFGRIVDAIFELFHVESRTSMDVKVCALACLNQAAFVTSCSLSQKSMRQSSFYDETSARWTRIWSYFLELLSSQSEKVSYTRCLLNTLTIFMRLPSLLSRTVVSSVATQKKIWDLACFRGHTPKELALDEAAANLALTFLVRFDLVGGRDTIASETNAGSFEGNHEYHSSFTSLMQTRRGRLVVWALTVPIMDVSMDSGSKLSEPPAGEQNYSGSTTRGESTRSGGNAPVSKSKSTAQLSTIAQLLCAASSPGIPLHTLCVGFGGLNSVSLQASRGFQAPTGDYGSLIHKEMLVNQVSMRVLLMLLRGPNKMHPVQNSVVVLCSYKQIRFDELIEKF